MNYCICIRAIDCQGRGREYSKHGGPFVQVVWVSMSEHVHHREFWSEADGRSFYETKEKGEQARMMRHRGRIMIQDVAGGSSLTIAEIISDFQSSLIAFAPNVADGHAWRQEEWQTGDIFGCQTVKDIFPAEELALIGPLVRRL